MIKAVFIDVDNTLLDFNRCSALSIKAALADYGFEYDDSMFPVFKRINDSLWNKIEKGELTREGLFKIRWNMIFKELDIPLDGVEFEKVYHDYLNCSTEKVQGADELLAYLYPKYTVCVTSNAHYEQQIKRLHDSGLDRFLHHIFISDKIGFPKPSAAFFDACFDELDGISPDEVIVIGDSPTADIDGGRNYGMKTCFFNFAHTDEIIEADYTVNSLAEIMNIL